MKKLFKKLALMVVALLTFSVGSNYTVKEVKAEGNGTWTLVTDVSTLAAGDKVVIAAKKANFAMSTTQNTNNRAQAAVTKSENTLTFTSSVQELTLKEGKTSGTFAFYTGSGYLYAASSSKNYLKTETTLSANSSWTIVIAASTGVATIKATGSNTRNWMRYNSSNNPPLFACYGSGQADICLYEYIENSTSEETPVASISISGLDYTQIGTTITLTETHKNVEGTVEWKSSNNDVATVVGGVVTPVSMGETTITATIGDVNATKDITVYPKANTEITIAEALKVCGLTGANNAPYVYSVTGTVKSIDEAYSSEYKNITVTITDGTDSIKAFRMKGGEELVVGDNITVTGNLCTYNSTPEFNSGCTYVLNESEEIKTIRTELNTINTYMSLAYEYTSKTESIEVEVPSVVSVTDILTTNGIGTTGNSYSSWNDKSFESNAVYSGNSMTAKDEEGKDPFNKSIQLRTTNNNSGIVTTTSGGIARKITVVWNSNTSSGRTLNVYGSHDAYAAPTELYGENPVGEILGTIVCGTTTELLINGNYEYIGLRSASSAMYLESISIEWEVEGEPTGETEMKDVTTFSSSNFFIRCGADVALKDIENIDYYGVKVSTSNNDVHYYSTSKAWGTELNTDPQYCYVVINLGDIINDVTKLTTKFTVEAFVQVGEDKYYSNNETTYSIVDMVKVYKEKNIEEVNHLYNYFVEEKLIVEEAN